MSDSTALHTLPLLFHGTLLNTHGIAISNAKIQLWQTDLNGNYLYPENNSAATNPLLSEHAEIISNFQYYGTDSTDEYGHFEFLTYRPGIYTMRPYSHFHFMVWLEEDDPKTGDDPSLVTQFYFKDETPPFPEVLQLDITEVDYSKYSYGSYVNGTIVVETPGEDGTTTTLLDASPTQPQGPFYPTTDFFSSGNDLTRALTNATAFSATPSTTLMEFPTTPFPTLQTPVPSPETSQADNMTPFPTPTTPFPTPDTAEGGDIFPTTLFPTLELQSSPPSTKYPTTPFPTVGTPGASRVPTTSPTTSSSTVHPVKPSTVSNDGVALRLGRNSAVALSVSLFAVIQFCIS